MEWQPVKKIVPTKFKPVKKWEKVDKLTTYTVKTPEIVNLLIAAFQNDFNITEACDYAKISRQTFYNWLEEDKDFAAGVEQAKRFIMLRAKQRGFQIIDKGSDRDAGPMVRWLLEKRQPEVYAPTIPGGQVNNQQNNFYLLNNEQLGDITKKSGIEASDPSELFEAIEAQPILEPRTKEESASSIHSQTL